MHAIDLADRVQSKLPRGSGPPLDTSLQSVFAAQPLETFAPQQGIFWEGDPSDHVFEIVQGCARLYRMLPDGRRAVTGFAFAGELVGTSLAGSCLYTAEAVTTVRLRRVSRRRLLSAVEQSESLRRQLLSKMYDELSAAQHLIVMLGQLSAEERVADFLLSAARRTGAGRKRPITIELPMSRLDIADYLGLTIETVCRIFSKFKRDGLIVIEGRQGVILRRIGSLQNLAGESEAEMPVFSIVPKAAAAWQN